jgi:DNA-binding NarL/FixJ family response regulator
VSLRILLVDDHALMREGLRSILEKESDIEVVGEAEDGRAALDLAARRSPDVIIMDLGMTNLNGIEATRQLVAANPRRKVIALSTYSDKRYVLAALRAGATGYVVKDEAGSELLRAIRAVSRAQVFLCPKVAGAVVEAYAGTIRGAGAASTVLGGREREVLQLIAEGNTSKEIASKLHISAGTVDSHRRNIMKKLDLHSVAALTKYAIREGLTSAES